MVFGAGIVVGGVVLGRQVTERVPSATSAAPRTTVSATAVSAPPASSTAPSPTVGLPADFTQLESSLHATVGLVAYAPGGRAQDPLVLGDLQQPEPAWSTSKVPLVIAALRQRNSAQVDDIMTKAITESDNAAAESMWEGLGAPEQAAAAVQHVLEQAGDPTIVESKKVRPEFTAFGQTMWALADQARFTAVAACDPQDAPVFNLMGQIESDQRWGLGIIPGARFKGGWGPSPSGQYLVRQMGVISTPGGLTVVTIAAQPTSGSFADGTQALTQIADWLTAHLVELPSGQCSQ
ncbi:MAG: hypothetical protein JHC64_29510 [Mycolicibacterium sp.]|nr:hypothetical protein [Mycolicibacterium sp.]